MFAVFAVAAFGACRAPMRASSALAPTADGLASTSRIACASETDCAVCYRQGTCGEAIAATDAEREAPACHVSPAAFCLARRARCENRVCVAR